MVDFPEPLGPATTNSVGPLDAAGIKPSSSIMICRHHHRHDMATALSVHLEKPLRKNHRPDAGQAERHA